MNSKYESAMEWKKHPQVPFTTLTGETVEVDEGLIYILEELKRLGVKTQFSCQGIHEKGKRGQSAYILADNRSFSRLTRKIYRKYKRRGYSPESMQQVRHFIKGYRMYEFAMFLEQGTNEVYKAIFSRGRKNMTRYSVERTRSATYGTRLTVRWPVIETDAILNLLIETETP